VLFSTSGMYGVPKQIPCREDAPKNPRNAYEESKLRSEEFAMAFHKEHGLPVTALRPTLVYGPGSKYGQAMYLTLFLCLKLWGMKSLPIGRGGRLTHHVHVDDVVSAVRILAEAPEAVGRAFNVADDKPVNAEDTMRMLCESTGLTVRGMPAITNTLLEPVFRFAPYVLESRVERLNQSLAKSWPKLVARHGLTPVLQPRFDIGWLAYLWADHHYATDALRALGWKPSHPSFLEGMRETVAWYQREKWLPTPEQMNRTSQETLPT
jgi:nucleoside-diphosphate-sugar epimerase